MQAASGARTAAASVPPTRASHCAVNEPCATLATSRRSRSGADSRCSRAPSRPLRSSARFTPSAGSRRLPAARQARPSRTTICPRSRSSRSSSTACNGNPEDASPMASRSACEGGTLPSTGPSSRSRSASPSGPSTRLIVPSSRSNRSDALVSVCRPSTTSSPEVRAQTRSSSRQDAESIQCVSSIASTSPVSPAARPTRSATRSASASARPSGERAWLRAVSGRPVTSRSPNTGSNSRWRPASSP